MVVEAQQGQIVDVRLPAGLPRFDVMGVRERRVRAAREPAVPVPSPDLAALGVGRLTPGPALEHRVADVVVDRDGDRRVTGDPPHGLAADQVVASPARRPGRSSHRTRRSVRPAARGPPRGTGWPTPTAARRPDRLEQGVAQALVPRRLPVGGDLAGPALEARPDLGVGVGGQLGSHRAVAVVEADEPPLVIAPRRPRPSERRAASSASCRTEHSRARSSTSRSVSGVAMSETARSLSKRDLALGQRGHQVREVPGPLGDVGVRPRRRRGHAEALDDPGLRRRRALVSIRLTPADLAQQHDDRARRRPPSGGTGRRAGR